MSVVARPCLRQCSQVWGALSVRPAGKEKRFNIKLNIYSNAVYGKNGALNILSNNVSCKLFVSYFGLFVHCSAIARAIPGKVFELYIGTVCFVTALAHCLAYRLTFFTRYQYFH